MSFVRHNHLGQCRHRPNTPYLAPKICRECESYIAALAALIATAYGNNWNRLPGGFPASYFNIFRRGTETSLQTFRIFISSVGAAQSLFDSQATFMQLA